MNEELQRRAQEAADRELEDWVRNSGDRRRWTTVVADAVLSVVADWCDEQRVAEPPVSRQLHGGYTSVARWNFAFETMAGACRPVEGDSKLSPADDPGSLDRGEDSTAARMLADQARHSTIGRPGEDQT